MRVGVFDSGIGGLNVLKEIMRKYPNSEYIYFGDTFYLPYGEKTKEELIKLGTRIIRFFEEQKVDRIIIACGTCSSLVEEYRKVTNIPIDDVIDPTVEYVKKHYHKVALLATPATIKNRIFEQKLVQKGVTVYPLACPNFVPYLEGMRNELEIEKELDFLQNKDYEAVILGCTHYPLLKDQIEKVLNVPSIDMGEVLSEQIKLEKSIPSLTIYMSKITPFLKQNVETILEQEVMLKNKNMPV